MKWETESSNCWKAVGQCGTFTIRRKGKMFWPEYTGHGGRHFKLPPSDKISRAKAMCVDNYYWEAN